MANKKLTLEQRELLLSMFDNGSSPADLARYFKVSASTVCRHLQNNDRKVVTREAHRVLMKDRVKSKLRRILSGYSVSNPDILISELDKNFLMDEREDEDFETIYV